jgi:hypothetical protein
MNIVVHAVIRCYTKIHDGVVTSARIHDQFAKIIMILHLLHMHACRCVYDVLRMCVDQDK